MQYLFEQHGIWGVFNTHSVRRNLSGISQLQEKERIVHDRPCCFSQPNPKRLFLLVASEGPKLLLFTPKILATKVILSTKQVGINTQAQISHDVSNKKTGRGEALTKSKISSFLTSTVYLASDPQFFMLVC